MAYRGQWLQGWLAGVALCAAGCADDATGTDVAPDDGRADAEADGASDVPPADGADDAEAAPTDGGEVEAWDGSCTSHDQCQDGLWCNGAERCEEGTCVSGGDPCDDGVECTVDSCEEDSDRCFHTGDDSMCQDGSACNGEEQCLAAGCSDGTSPVCADSSPCTIDSCDDARGGCVHDPRDFDEDGYMTRDYGCDAEGGTDCNDRDATVNPGAVEVCDDIRDNNCDTVADFADPACRPVNDSCPGTLLEEGVAVNSSTRATVHDYSPACCTWCSYQDVAFQIDLPDTLDIVVDITSRSGTIYADLQRTCGNASTSLRCLSGGTVTLRRNSQPAGSYWVIVDGTNADFTISYHTEGPTPIPPNDVCTGAIDIPSAGGVVSGSLLDTSNHFVPTCAGGGAYPDVFYRLVLTEPHRLTITATLSPAVYSTYVSLTRTCGDSSTEIACGSGSAATLTRNFLDAGTYFIAVDGSAESPFTLDVRLEPPVYPPANDTCAGAEDVPAGGGLVSGTLLSASDHYVPTCAGAGRYPDAFYRLVLTEPHRITITAQLTPATASTYVTLGPTCGEAATETMCAAGSTATLTRNFLDTGTYFIAVDGSTESPFTLNVRLDPPIYPPANDRCPGTDITGGGVFVGTMVDTYRDYPPSCSTATLSDVVYNFTLTDTQDVTVNVAPVGASTTYVAALRTTCDDHLTELACRSGSPAQFSRHSLPAGTYYLVVSGPTVAPGNQFVLQLTLAPPTPVPANDVCLGATDVSAGGRFVGTTWGCADDYAPTCGTTLTYSDLVYALHLAAPQEVTIDLSSAAPTVYLDVRNGTCGTGTTAISCTSGATAHFSNPNLPAGDYWILVDPSVEGATTLDVGLAAPSSACDGSETITVDYTSSSTFVYTDSATTAGRPDDFDPSCIYGAYPDYPYQLVVPVRSAVTVTTDTTTYDGALHMRSACDVPSSEIGCDDDCGSTLRSCVPISGSMTLEPGTYTIIVDGYSGSGDFTLTVTATRL
ncbi:MAG: putative metal-binding motif-containing protein [Deltaproteobacteria bacterium]|nr:putative metal-binding motif-containing protein [Deltaproteobacteria bacterium]